MSTAGYDVVVEVSEKLVNGLITEAFYASAFELPAFTGRLNSKDLNGSVLKAPINYRLRFLDPPMLLFHPDKSMLAVIKMEATVPIPGGMSAGAELAASANVIPTFEPDSDLLRLKLDGLKVDRLFLADILDVPNFVLRGLNRTIPMALRSSMLDSLTELRIPLALPPIKLPADALSSSAFLGPMAGVRSDITNDEGSIKNEPVPQENEAEAVPPPMTNDEVHDQAMHVAIGFAGIVGPGRMTIGLNIGDNDRGNANELASLTDDHSLSVAISNNGLGRIFNSVWSSMPHSYSGQNTMAVPDYGGMVDMMASGFEFITTLGRLGFERKKAQVERSRVNYGATISLTGAPKVRLLEGARFEVFDIPLKVHAWAEPIMDVSGPISRSSFDSVRNFFSRGRKTDVRREQVTLPRFTQDLDLTGETIHGAFVIDGEGHVSVKIDDMRLSLHLNWDLPKAVLEGILNWLSDRVIDRFPAFDLSDMLRSVHVAGIPLTVDLIASSITGDEDETLLIGDLKLDGQQRARCLIPRYVGYSGLDVMEVHRMDCKRVKSLEEGRKEPFYQLYDALDLGYHGCPSCLPEFVNVSIKQPSTPRTPVTIMSPAK